MGKYLLILLMVFSAFAQEILSPNKTYTFKEKMIVYTEQEFNFIDSLLADTLRYQNIIKKLKEERALGDSINKGLDRQTLNLNLQIDKLQAKNSFLLDNDSLWDKKCKIYKGVIDDINKELEKKQKSKGFFNNTFWFGSGIVVGGLTMYLSSIIVSNVSQK